MTAHKLLEPRATPKNHERHGRHEPRSRPHQDVERKVKRVAVDKRAIQVYDERDGIGHRG